MNGGEKTKDISKPLGTSQPQVVCRAVCVGLCFLKVCEKERLRRFFFFPNRLKCCFCDRFTDQFSKPKRANPCSYAPGKMMVFEADGICVLCRQTVKTCWFVQGINCSTGFASKMFTYCELLANFPHWGMFSFLFCLSSHPFFLHLSPLFPYLHTFKMFFFLKQKTNRVFTNSSELTLLMNINSDS